MQNDILLHFSDESTFLDAVKSIKERGLNIKEYYTPAGLSDKSNWFAKYLFRSISSVGFVGGIVGAFLGFIFQLFMYAHESSMNMGGIQFSPPAVYLPIIFEGALLVSGLAMFIKYQRELNKQKNTLSILPESDQFYVLYTSEENEAEQFLAEAI